MERGAGKLAVEDFYAVPRFHDLEEGLEIVRGDLVAEAAAATVEHDHDLIRNRNAETFRQLRVEHVFRSRHLDLQIVITGAERADLFVAALHRFGADLRGVGPTDATLLLRSLEILWPAIAVVDAPAGSLFDQVAKFFLGDFDEAGPSHARRHPLKEP